VAKKDFLTVAKITRSDQIIRDFAFTLMARFDAPSNDQINPALALFNLATPAGKSSILATFFACEVAKCVLN
jgi:hypothetical protein